MFLRPEGTILQWRKLIGQRPILGGKGGGVHGDHPSGKFGHGLILVGAFLGHLTEMWFVAIFNSFNYWIIWFQLSTGLITLSTQHHSFFRNPPLY